MITFKALGALLDYPTAELQQAANEIEQALGEERIQWLMEQTGMPKDQLLQGLSGELPQAIDKLTPDGRIPTDDELSRLQ